MKDGDETRWGYHCDTCHHLCGRKHRKTQSKSGPRNRDGVLREPVDPSIPGNQTAKPKWRHSRKRGLKCRGCTNMETSRIIRDDILSEDRVTVIKSELEPIAVIPTKSDTDRANLDV